MSSAHYLQTYRQHQVETTDPGTLLLLLYQGAMDFVKRARISLDRGDFAEKGRLLSRAQAIISEFLSSLDFSVGGELARNLEGLYVYMLDQITAANLNNDPRPLDVVLSILGTLKEGWEGAIAAERKKALQGKA